MIAVALDGFLRTHAKVSIPHAVRMFADLTRSFPTTVLANADMWEADLWLKNRGLRDYVGIYGDEVPTRTGETLRQAQVAKLRTEGPLDLVIDPDPGTAAWLVATGTPALLYASPSYSRPEFRPDAAGRRSWDEIQTELDRQERLIAEDTRLRVGDGSARYE